MTLNPVLTTTYQFGNSHLRLKDKELLSNMSLTVTPIDFVAHWQRCGKTADFISSFQSFNFQDRPKVNLIFSAVVNEMLENAVKFNADNFKPIFIEVNNYANYLSIETKNISDDEQVRIFDAYLKKLDSNDMESLFLDQLLSSAESDNNQSGLGIISLRKDFNADIWISISPETDSLFKINMKIIMCVDDIDV